MTDLEKVWNFCEQQKNNCDKNIEKMGLDNLTHPVYQNIMGASTAYWAVQKCIEDIQETTK